MAALAPDSVLRTEKCPLTRPLVEFDANMTSIPDDVPILTLLATDEGWTWLDVHIHALAAGAETLIAAASTASQTEWTVVTFVSGGVQWSLMTREPAEGLVRAALLEVFPAGSECA